MRRALLGVVTFFVAAPFSSAQTWHDATALKTALEELAGPHTAIARLTSYGKSRAGGDLWCVELGPVDKSDRAALPALLIVAGLDGQHLIGTEVALDHVRRLIEGYGKDDAVTQLLDHHVVYVLPRANPDGAAAFFLPPGGAKRELRGDLAPVDDDRDGSIDEDGPTDLDGDGFITQRRWKDPAGTLIEDPNDPRLLRPADPLKGEKGVWKVAIEGIDQDGDGECGEDGVGDVVPARNFPQRWSEADPTAGRFPMEQPEAQALGKFVLDRPAIALALVYGLNDNVAVDAKPDTVNEGGRFIRSMPTGIVKDDQPLFAEFASRYRATTGVTSKPPLDADDGSLANFLYFQFGIPTLAMHVWSPPLDVKPAAGGDGKPGESDEVKLLRWNDQVVAGAAFTPWTKVADPAIVAKLGKSADGTPLEVEVGGWRPYARVLPPIGEVAALAQKHSDFLLQLAPLFARLELATAKVESLGGNAWRVTATLVNQGFLPTVCGMAERNRRPKPTRLDLELKDAKLLQGEKRHTWSRIESQGRRDVTWLIQAEPGSTLTLRYWSEKSEAGELPVVLK